ncbi:MAG: fatty acid desaturase [Caulobacteraceae bacterium]|nr:fatty acid desaturase [Caulobacteraceae bacterium]
MDEVFARPGMIDMDRLKVLSEKSDARGWLQVASHFGAIGLTGWAVHASLGTAWVVLPFVMHGVLLNYLYAGEHEFSHSTVFKSPALNEWFGRLCGLLTIHPRDFDQIQHFAHHRYTQKWAQDGELFRPRYTYRSFLFTMTGLWMVRRLPRMFMDAVKGRVDAPYIRGKNRDKVILEARVTVAIYVAVALLSLLLHSWAALLYWFAPLVLTKWAHQPQNLIEHNGLPHEGPIHGIVRSTRTNAFMRWMCWNMQYHTAHHAYPSVPFHRLKQLHQEAFTANGVEPPTMTYLGFYAAMLKALRERGEAEQPDDAVWIGPTMTMTRAGAPEPAVQPAPASAA